MPDDSALREDAVRRMRADYDEVFGGEAGRRVLSDLFGRFGGARWYATPPTPETAMFEAGERNVVNYVLELLGRRSDPVLWNKAADDGALVSYHDEKRGD